MDRGSADSSEPSALPPPISIEQAMAPVAQRAEPEAVVERAAEMQPAEPSTSASSPAPTVTAPEVESAPAPAPEPIQVTVQSAPPTAESAPVVEKVDLHQVLQSSGLQLVETRFKAEIVPEPAFVPAKRERRPPPASLNEPLAQVETAKSSSAAPPN